MQVVQSTIFVQLKQKILKPWSREIISLDLNIAIPEECYGNIVGRSGLVKTCGITVHNGVIDSDYLGIVCMIVFNLFNEEYMVANNPIGQLSIDRCYTPKFVEVNEFSKEKT